MSASAIGYYGYDRGDEVLTEASSQGDGFLADVVARWEQATAPASRGRAAGRQSAHGHSPDRPVAECSGLLYPVFLLGLGGKAGQWPAMDVLDGDRRPGRRVLPRPARPGPERARQCRLPSARAQRRVHRHAGPGAGPAEPCWPYPGFAADLALGPEGRREVAEASQRVEPTVLLAAGHHFRYPELEGALRHLLGRVVN